MGQGKNLSLINFTLMKIINKTLSNTLPKSGCSKLPIIVLLLKNFVIYNNTKNYLYVWFIEGSTKLYNNIFSGIVRDRTVDKNIDTPLKFDKQINPFCLLTLQFWTII